MKDCCDSLEYPIFTFKPSEIGPDVCVSMSPGMKYIYEYDGGAIPGPSPERGGSPRPGWSGDDDVDMKESEGKEREEKILGRKRKLEELVEGIISFEDFCVACRVEGHTLEGSADTKAEHIRDILNDIKSAADVSAKEGTPRGSEASRPEPKAMPRKTRWSKKMAEACVVDYCAQAKLLIDLVQEYFGSRTSSDHMAPVCPRGHGLMQFTWLTSRKCWTSPNCFTCRPERPTKSSGRR